MEYKTPRQLDESPLEGGNIDDIDKFNAPPAGHSLTDAPGQYTWEKPPQFTDPEEARTFIIERAEKPEVEENFLRLMLSGVPIEAITNTVCFTGFAEGYWNPDMCEILKPPVSLHFVGLALENEIPATMFNNEPNIKREENRISDEKVMKLMEKNRPDMYNKIMYASDLLLDDSFEERVEQPEMVEQPEAFMDMEEEEVI